MSDQVTFSGDQKIKITQIINDGMATLTEIETLNGGLNDTIKAVAEELGIKPSILKKAVKIAHKAGLTQQNNDHETLNTILEVAGKTL
jgi:transposase-like protein